MDLSSTYTSPGKIRKTKDTLGRTWVRVGHRWQYGPHTVGAGSTTTYSYQVYSGPNASDREYKTLREAMAACSDTEAAQ